jgi:hypothetical protein
MVIGADFYTIFLGRLVFSVLIVAVIAQLIKRLDDHFCERYFYRSVAQ